MNTAGESRRTPAEVVVERDVMVDMRDGIRLATDVYRPIDRAGEQVSPLPVIMERTPYDKCGVSRSEVSVDSTNPATRVEVAEFFARQGYVVVMQDCRGRYKSEGEFVKYVNEAADGFDAITWVARQSWCNGAVGTMGLSYGAHTQCALASLNPPGLACMFLDSGGFASAYHGGIRRGGAFELKQATWAYRHALRSPATLADPVRLKALQDTDIREWFRHMPWRPGNSPLTSAPEYESYLFELWSSGLFSDYWKRPGLYAEGYYDCFLDVPTAIVGSWYDPYVYSCITNFHGLSKSGNSAVTLLMGPWTHGNRSVTYAGDVDFGSQSTLDGNISADYRQFRLSWFDRWLKNSASPSEKSVVTYFQMGGGSGDRNADGRLHHGGVWRNADSWPPTEVAMHSLYLRADGRLLPQPVEEPGYLEYQYDPGDPVPTIGGALTSGEPVMKSGAFDQRENEHVLKIRGEPGREQLSGRPDVLVFETDPLPADTIITGEIEIELWVSSDCRDTDFTAKIVDLYPPSEDFPDGFAMNITDGIFRARYREGWESEVMMEPGQIYRIEIRPFATSNLFKTGHRLRIDISSSNYPQFDLNSNTGEPEGRATHFTVANNRLHFGGSYSSRVVLPVASGG